MKNKTNILLIIILIISACTVFIAIRNSFYNLPKARRTLYGDIPKSKRLLIGFGDQITHEAQFGPRYRGNDVQDYLDYGVDPNYCLKMYNGWQYRNPLMLFCTDLLIESYFEENQVLPDYDVKVFNQLIEAGADKNKYPFIWTQIYLFNNEEMNFFRSKFNIKSEEIDLFNSCYISDCNREIKLFLDAGADVNKKGSPIPFQEDICERISEKKIQNYFNSPEATTPIYEAIKKGSLWESQVDLLLEYGAIVDDSCLEAAKLSGDEAMIKKIEKLLNKSVNN